MDGFLLLLGFVFGCITTIILKSIMNSCDHEWEHESTTIQTRRDIPDDCYLYKVKHYQCKKCLRVKSIRIQG